jgi:hypothetical protein
MTIFGRDQALFKAGNMARPGQPSKEEAYVLSEGERQDDIEVVKIDHVDGIITFNNHGTFQELPLVPAKDSGGNAGGGLDVPNGLPRFPVANIPRPRPMIGAAMRGDQPAGIGMNSSNLGQASGGANLSGNFGHMNLLGNGGFQSPINQQSSPQNNIEDQVMSAAKDMAQIELNRIATQDLVDQGRMPPLPPTMMTPQDATGIGGVPLISPNNEPPPPVAK